MAKEAKKVNTTFHVDKMVNKIPQLLKHQCARVSCEVDGNLEFIYPRSYTTEVGLG